MILFVYFQKAQFLFVFSDSTVYCLHFQTALLIVYIFRQHCLLFTFSDSTVYCLHFQTTLFIVYIFRQHCLLFTFSDSTVYCLHFQTTLFIVFFTFSESTVDVWFNLHGSGLREALYVSLNRIPSQTQVVKHYHFMI